MRNYNLCTTFLFLIIPFWGFLQGSSVFGTAAANEYGLSIAADALGNAYVGGSSGNEAWIIKRDSQNNTVWSQLIDVPGVNTADISFIDVIADTVFGCGWVRDGNTIKGGIYFKANATTGVPYWIKAEQTSRNYFSCMRYANGKYFLTGSQVNGANGYSGKVWAVSSATGASIWQTPAFGLKFQGYNIDYVDDLKSSTQMINGKMFITGRSYVNGAAGGNNMRPLLIGVSETGNIFLTKYVLFNPQTSGTNRYYGYSISYDGADSLVIGIAGDDNCSSCTDYKSGFVKTDLSGNVSWAKQYDIAGVTAELLRGLNVTEDGYVMYGTTNFSVGNSKIFVLKTNKQGVFQDARIIGKTTGQMLCVSGVLNVAGSSCYRNGKHYFSGSYYLSNANSRDVAQLVVDQDLNDPVSCLISTSPAVTTAALVPFSQDLIKVDFADVVTNSNLGSTIAHNFTSACNATVVFQQTQICSDVTITANVSGISNPTYSWSNGESTQTITTNSSADLIVTISDPQNCCHVIDTVSPAPHSYIHYNISETICQGESYLFGGNQLTQQGIYIDTTSSCDSIITLTLNVGPTFSISSNVVSNTCNASGQEGEITIAVSPAGNYTYIWSHNPALNNPIASGLTSGTYTVSISNGFCLLDTTISINTISGITAVSTIVENEFCNTLGSIDITGISGGTSPYSTSMDGITFTPNNLSFQSLASGTYTIFIKDENSCIYNFTSVINDESTIPVISLTLTRNCENGLNELVLSATGNGNLEFSIDGNIIPQYGNIMDSLLPGSYLVSVSDANQCVGDTVVTIAPFNSYTEVDFSVSDALCTNDNGILQINQVVGNYFDYTVEVNSVASSSDLIPGLSSGNYTLSITDGFCALDTSFTINYTAGIENVDLTTVHFNCQQLGNLTINEIIGGTSPYLSSLDNSAFSNSLFYSDLQSATYLLEIVDVNNCVFDTLVIIQDHSNDLSLVIDIQTNCQSQLSDVELIASNGLNGGFTYDLESEITSTGIYTDLEPGIYNLSVLDDQGCTLDTSFTINSFNSMDSLVFSIQNAYCGNSNGSFVLEAAYGNFVNPIYIFQNETISILENISGLQAGIYTLEVTDINGCTYDTTVSIPMIQPDTFSLNYSSHAPGCGEKGSISIEEVSGGFPPYYYSFNGGAFGSNSNFQYLEDGLLGIDIVDNVGCEFNYAIPLQGSTEFETLFIPNCFTPDGDESNPVWFVKGNCVTEFECIIFNRWGQVIFEYMDIDAYWDGTFAGEICQDGVYFYKINVQYFSGKKQDYHGHITLFR